MPITFDDVVRSIRVRRAELGGRMPTMDEFVGRGTVSRGTVYNLGGWRVLAQAAASDGVAPIAAPSDAEKRLEALLAVRAREGKVTAIKPLAKRGTKNEACPVICASDWHAAEIVDPRHVEGLNESNPAIFQERAENFFRNSLRLVDIERTGARIEQMVLWLGGDMINNTLHDDIRETGQMRPVEETRMVRRSIEAGLRYYLAHSDMRLIKIVCNYGNHGRTTDERRITGAGENSYEVGMYLDLAETFKDEKRLEWHIAPGPMLHLPVYDMTIRFTHGDTLKGGGGVGGLTIPFRKRVMAWDRAKAAYLTVIGHFHQFADYGYGIGNGSLVGYNAYALSIGAAYEPPQQAFFMIDSEWKRKTAVRPIFVTRASSGA